MVAPAPSTSDSMATKDQLVQAQEYLGTLRSDRAESCRELEEEAKVFLDSPSTPEQDRRFRLIYQLLRYQVRPLNNSELSNALVWFVLSWVLIFIRKLGMWEGEICLPLAACFYNRPLNVPSSHSGVERRL